MTDGFTPSPEDEAVVGEEPGGSAPAPEAESEPAPVEAILDEYEKKIADLEDQLARARADYFNLQQEYNGYVRRSKQEQANARAEGKASVLEGLLSVLDDAHLAREHGDLTGSAGTIVDKLEQTLATRYGLERFGSVGDPFDPEIHEALMHAVSDDVESEQVQHLMQPGYRHDGKVLRPARVGVVSPQ